MRFDDTNPAKEDVEYVNSILRDVKWLVAGTDKPTVDPWFGPIRYASSYFSVIYDAAEYLISQGLAYVDELSAGACSVVSAYSNRSHFTYLALFLQCIRRPESLPWLAN